MEQILRVGNSFLEETNLLTRHTCSTSSIMVVSVDLLEMNQELTAFEIRLKQTEFCA